MSDVTVPANDFVGREADIEHIRATFSGRARLITLWGTAGIGKTRLATEFAAHHAAEGYSAVFCDLSTAHTLDSAHLVIANALGAHIADGAGVEQVVEQLGYAIVGRGRLLLVLDNLEQIVDAMAPSIAHWCARAERGKFLITSRERLRIDGEHTFEIKPLALQSSKHWPAGCAAGQLFFDRTVALFPEFVLDDESTAGIQDLVRKLEGIPLAIELAAARMDLLGLDELRANLSERLAVLNVGARGGSPRQSTLRAAIAWSWDLLSDDERTVLAQASVFCGRFGLAASGHVLRANSADATALDLMQSLRDKSLLLVDRDENFQFRMYESVRAFAAEQLEQFSLTEATHARHTEYYLEHAERMALDFETTGSVTSLQAISATLENLLAVFERTVAAVRPTPDVALRVVLAIDIVLATRGTIQGHVALLERALDGARQGGVDGALLAQGMRALGNVQRLRGDGIQASRLLSEALELVPVSERANVLADLGVVHHQRREMAEAARLYREAEQAARAAKKNRVLARVLGNIGALHHDVGEFGDAAKQYKAALRLFQDVGDLRLQGICLTNLGVLELEQGKLPQARGRFELAMSALEQIADRRLIAITVGNMGLLEHLDGDLDLARKHHRAALVDLQTVGDTRSEALATIRLGASEAAAGEVHQAVRSFVRAEQMLERFDDELGSGLLSVARAFVAVAEAQQARLCDEPVELVGVHTDIAAARAGSPSLVERSDDARILVRLLEKELAMFAGGDQAESANALVVGPEAKWFRAPGGQWQDIARRRQLRKMLLCLVERRRSDPGGAVSLQQLQDAAWPGDKAATDAAANRAYVLLTKLRKLGLHDLLLREDTGYLLDPKIKLQRIATHWKLWQVAADDDGADQG